MVWLLAKNKLNLKQNESYIGISLSQIETYYPIEINEFLELFNNREFLYHLPFFASSDLASQLFPEFQLFSIYLLNFNNSFTKIFFFVIFEQDHGFLT